MITESLPVFGEVAVELSWQPIQGGVEGVNGSELGAEVIEPAYPNFEREFLGDYVSVLFGKIGDLLAVFVDAVGDGTA